MADTKIEWAEKVWNPIAGCTKCSPGCLNCYAEKMAHRIKHICLATNNNPQYLGKTDDDGKWTGEVECCYWKLEEPLHCLKPQRIFVCSMSDLFHPKVPEGFIIDVFDVIAQAAAMGHTILILTKRVKRMWEILGEYCSWLNPTDLEAFSPYKQNIHIGVSISIADEMWKVKELSRIPAAVRWISFEPLLKDVGKIPIENISWVVVGGESGPGARPMHPDWARSIRDQCLAANVPFYFKQWGEYYPVFGEGKVATSAKAPKAIYVEPGPVCMLPVGKKKAGCILDGREWKKLPERR